MPFFTGAHAQSLSHTFLPYFLVPLPSLASHLSVYFILYVLLAAQLTRCELFFPHSLMAATGCWGVLVT